MKAILKTKADRGLSWSTSEPIPEPKQGEVRVQISRTAICGSDLHLYQWNEWAQSILKPPMIIGHEFVGTIEKIGLGVTNWKIGETVSGEGHLVCGNCRNCRAGKKHYCIDTRGIGISENGAFAEYLVIPATNLYKIPDTMSHNIAAILDPFGNAVHTALSFNLIGEDVLITGAGPIGIMAGIVAQHVGARNTVITDISETRLSMAQNLGLPHAILSSNQAVEKEMKKLGVECGFDVGFEMSGNQNAMQLMIRHMHHGGHIALLGVADAQIQIDINQVVFKSITLRGIYGREIFETWYKMIAMLEGGLDLSKLVTHELAAEDFESGFSLLEKGEALKVVLTW